MFVYSDSVASDFREATLVWGLAQAFLSICTQMLKSRRFRFGEFGDHNFFD